MAADHSKPRGSVTMRLLGWSVKATVALSILAVLVGGGAAKGAHFLTFLLLTTIPLLRVVALTVAWFKAKDTVSAWSGVALLMLIAFGWVAGV